MIILNFLIIHFSIFIYIRVIFLKLITFFYFYIDLRFILSFMNSLNRNYFFKSLFINFIYTIQLIFILLIFILFINIILKYHFILSFNPLIPHQMNIYFIYFIFIFQVIFNNYCKI